MPKAAKKKPESRGICPHCGLERSFSTIRTHLKKNISDDLEQLNEASGAIGANEIRCRSSTPLSQVNPEPLINQAHAAVRRPEALIPPSSIRLNPPVTIVDWPEPAQDPTGSDDEDSDPELLREGEDMAIESDEDEEISHHAAEWTDEEFHRFLQEQFGDAIDSKLADLGSDVLTTADERMIKLLGIKLRTFFSRETYEELRWEFEQEVEIPTEYIAWRRLRILSGIESRAYDCCIRSCCCFLGKYASYRTCPFCKELRFDSRGKPRKQFHYTALIPQLQAMFQNLSMVDKLKYRSQFKPDTSLFRDIFDGSNYTSLLHRQISTNDQYQFFQNPQDIALGLSTDGFTLFKRRRRGNATAWPIILINYNLPPEIRNHLENVICVGIIPGPRQFKDLYSFLIPLIEELLRLAHGVDSHGFPNCDSQTKSDFVLRAFLIIVFGDIPAVTKLLAIKGHNAIYPCRACLIYGIRSEETSSNVYYVPHTHPGELFFWETDKLLMRTHKSFLEVYERLEEASTQSKRARDEVAQQSGINSPSIFAHLRSIDLATSFPYDLMHLIYENLVPNLILHWTGDFKGLDSGKETYGISLQDWQAIGIETANATHTLPSEFIGTLPNIEADRNLFKAEAYAFWIQHIAPIVLQGRLADPYYEHVLLLRKVIATCLQYSVTQREVDQLEQWIIEYYYQFQDKRLSACPLTIHALLHIPYYIRHTGPLWTSWAFVMERFCGHLLPAVKSRTRPYRCLDNYVQRRAQMEAVTTIFNLPARRPGPRVITTKDGVEISRTEKVYDEYPASILGYPVTRTGVVDGPLLNQLTKYLGPILQRPRRELENLIITESIIRYGRVRIAGRDKMRASDGQLERDNSYVRFTLFPDVNAAFRSRPDVPVAEIHYGQLNDILLVDLHEHGEEDVPRRLLLARVQPCDTHGCDATKEVVTYSRMLAPIIVNLQTVEAVVGRVPRNGGGWSIVDKSGKAARTQFTGGNGASYTPEE